MYLGQYRKRSTREITARAIIRIDIEKWFLLETDSVESLFAAWNPLSRAETRPAIQIVGKLGGRQEHA